MRVCTRIAQHGPSLEDLTGLAAYQAARAKAAATEAARAQRALEEGAAPVTST